jgi:sirohydrochlorin cobaltochelatase
MHTKAGPFTRLVIGRPALGSFGSQYHYTKDINAVAQTMGADIERARKENAALVYMGHGNKYYPSSAVYLEFAAEMNRLYPDILTAIMTLKGVPSIDDAVARLKEHNVKKVLLKPFMVVAGSHARRDMIGDNPDSLQNRLEAEGFSVDPVISGLGEQDAFAGIFVQHAADAARDAGIELR